VFARALPDLIGIQFPPFAEQQPPDHGIVVPETNPLRGYANRDCIGRDVGRNHGTRSDNCAGPDRHAGHDDGSRADPDVIANGDPEVALDRTQVSRLLGITRRG